MCFTARYNGITLTLWGASLENDLEYLKSIQISASKGFIKNHHVNGKCVVIVRKNKGRLGNKMYMYSTAYSFARKRNCCMHYHAENLNELRQIFLLNRSNVCMISDEDFAKLTTIPRANNIGCMFYIELMHNVFNKSIELTGYWQSYRYFIDYEQEIRDQFTFNDTILLTVTSYLLRQNIHNRVLVGVHVRRGDFLSFRHSAIGGSSASSIEYIYSGMNYFTQKYSSPLFIVVSDDKLWCKETLGLRNDVIITPSNFSAAEDLAVLTLCDHNLITTGTYSWWAGYFSKGEVIYDKTYFKKGSLFSWNCLENDNIPPKFKSLM
jgi:galactoside 2-L-fucosyltransferase 1/2